jgi:RNA polymerase sigma-70 factor (ECF subfamily)
MYVVPHEAAMRRWLRSFSALGEPDIDDLVQETYAVLAMRDSVEGIADPRSYAFQVAKSLFLQNVRRAKVVSISAGADLASLDIPVDAPSPFQHAAGREDLERVAEAIRAMPPQTRRAFWLRRVEGWSQREIAAATALSENTVEKHIARGIRILMEQFGRGGKAVRRASYPDTDPFEGMEDAQGSSETDDRSRDRRHYR